MNKFIFTREAIELSYLHEQPFLPIVIQSGQHAYGVARSFMRRIILRVLSSSQPENEGISDHFSPVVRKESPLKIVVSLTFNM